MEGSQKFRKWTLKISIRKIMEIHVEFLSKLSPKLILNSIFFCKVKKEENNFVNCCALLRKSQLYSYLTDKQSTEYCQACSWNYKLNSKKHPGFIHRFIHGISGKLRFRHSISSFGVPIKFKHHGYIIKKR